MKKLIFPIMVAVFIGSVCGYFILNQYPDKQNLYSVFSEEYKLYFLQVGVYSTKENMEQNLNNEHYYIYSEVDGMYYVYLAITKQEENIDKLKGYFNSLGYDIYVKEFTLDNESFKNIIDQYDALLEGTDDINTIKAICSQILAKYEELVITE